MTWTNNDLSFNSLCSLVLYIALNIWLSKYLTNIGNFTILISEVKRPILVEIGSGHKIKMRNLNSDWNVNSAKFHCVCVTFDLRHNVVFFVQCHTPTVGVLLNFEFQYLLLKTVLSPIDKKIHKDPSSYPLYLF